MKIVAKRLKEGEDLKLVIEKLVSDENLSAAIVISAVGSLSHARLRMPGAKPDEQDIRDYEGPFEIASLLGNLGQSRTHLHMSVSDSESRVIGGHLKEGSIVHTTVELVLATDDSLEFSEEADPKTGFGELKVKKL